MAIEGDNTRHFTIIEHGEIENLIMGIVSRFVIGHDDTMTQFLTDLAAHFDQPVKFED